MTRVKDAVDYHPPRNFRISPSVRVSSCGAAKIECWAKDPLSETKSNPRFSPLRKKLLRPTRVKHKPTHKVLKVGSARSEKKKSPKPIVDHHTRNRPTSSSVKFVRDHSAGRTRVFVKNGSVCNTRRRVSVST
jgi:hypothetical protein